MCSLDLSFQFWYIEWQSNNFSVCLPILHTISQLMIAWNHCTWSNAMVSFILMLHSNVTRRKSTRCFDLSFFVFVLFCSNFITVIVFIVRSINVTIDPEKKKEKTIRFAGIAQSFHASMSTWITKNTNRKKKSQKQSTKKMEAKQCNWTITSVNPFNISIEVIKNYVFQTVLSQCWAKTTKMRPELYSLFCCCWCFSPVRTLALFIWCIPITSKDLFFTLWIP